MQAESDGRSIVIFSGSAPRSLQGKLLTSEKLGLGAGMGIEFVEAAIIDREFEFYQFFSLFKF